jgi:hypothetical protein
MPTKPTPHIQKNHLQIGLGILAALIVAVFLFKSGGLLPKDPKVVSPERIAAIKTVCDRFAGAEKSDCETRLVGSEQLTNVVSAAAAKGDTKPCDTVDE